MNAIGKVSASLIVTSTIIITSIAGATVMYSATLAGRASTGSSTSSSVVTTSGQQANSSGILTVTCIDCTPSISSQSQYLVTVGWSISYALSNSGKDNVSQYQNQANGTTKYLITTLDAAVPYDHWFANWLIQDHSKSGGNLTATFTLADSGATINIVTTSSFPDIIQGNYSSDTSYAEISSAQGFISTLTRSTLTQSNGSTTTSSSSSSLSTALTTSSSSSTTNSITTVTVTASLTNTTSSVNFRPQLYPLNLTVTVYCPSGNCQYTGQYEEASGAPYNIAAAVNQSFIMQAFYEGGCDPTAQCQVIFAWTFSLVNPLPGNSIVAVGTVNGTVITEGACAEDC